MLRAQLRHRCKGELTNNIKLVSLLVENRWSRFYLAPEPSLQVSALPCGFASRSLTKSRWSILSVSALWFRSLRPSSNTPYTVKYISRRNRLEGKKYWVNQRGTVNGVYGG